MKTKLKLPIEVGKTYYTNAGKEVCIYRTKNVALQYIHGAIKLAGEWSSYLWNQDGTAIHHNRKNRDIVYEENNF